MRPKARTFARARAGAFACLCVLLGVARSTAAPTITFNEYEVKAALVFRTAKFIEWPDKAFADLESPFVTCVVGGAELMRPFAALDGKLIGKHPISVRRITGDMLDLRQCHAAFFPANAGQDVDYALGKLQDAPVLTVGETEEFTGRGGMLALITRDQRVTFTVNLRASKRAGFTVSSQLLQLATVVGQGSER